MTNVEKTDLKDCRTYGFTLLQLMTLLAVVGVIAELALRLFS